MSLKPLELQVALPRTVDHSRNQQIEQHQHHLQNQVDQEEMQQQATQLEQTVISSEQKSKAQLQARSHDGSGDGAAPRGGRDARKKAAEAEQAPHPYKGHRLDISL